MKQFSAAPESRRRWEGRLPTPRPGCPVAVQPRTLSSCSRAHSSRSADRVGRCAAAPSMLASTCAVGWPAEVVAWWPAALAARCALRASAGNTVLGERSLCGPAAFHLCQKAGRGQRRQMPGSSCRGFLSCREGSCSTGCQCCALLLPPAMLRMRPLAVCLAGHSEKSAWAHK